MTGKSKIAATAQALAIAGVLSVPQSGASQTPTFRGCNVDDAICMDELVGEHCVQPLPEEREPCIEILADLERRFALAEPEVLVNAAFAHAMLAWNPTSDAEAASHRVAAEDLYRQVIAIEAHSDAYMGLALLTEDLEERVRWLRLAAEARDYNSLVARSLASALDDLGTREAELEAAQAIRFAYERTEPGRHKSYLAQIVVWRYRRLGLDAEALEFIEQFRADYGVEAHLDALLEAASAPERALETLASLCSQEVFNLIGASGCRTGAARLFAVTERVDDPALARRLAVGTVREIMELPSETDGTSSAPDIVGWLERLPVADMSAWEIYAALGRCRLALDQPDAALAALERARSIASDAGATASERVRIDEYIGFARSARLPDFYRDICPARVISIN